MENLFDLLFKAYAKFLGAGLTVDHAHYGIFGIWVGPSNNEVLSDGAQLERAQAFRDAWPTHFGDTPNPYCDLVAFYEAGASLGRWEDHILDVFGPKGEALGGIPRATFLYKVKNTAIY